jgi:hypothetical protein
MFGQNGRLLFREQAVLQRKQARRHAVFRADFGVDVLDVIAGRLWRHRELRGGDSGASAVDCLSMRSVKYGCMRTRSHSPGPNAPRLSQMALDTPSRPKA